MNRPVFPRIPESRRRAQERASARARVPVDQPAGRSAVPSDAEISMARAPGTTDDPRTPGTPDKGAAP